MCWLQLYSSKDSRVHSSLSFLEPTTCLPYLGWLSWCLPGSHWKPKSLAPPLSPEWERIWLASLAVVGLARGHNLEVRTGNPCHVNDDWGQQETEDRQHPNSLPVSPSKVLRDTPFIFCVCMCVCAYTHTRSHACMCVHACICVGSAWLWLAVSPHEALAQFPSPPVFFLSPWPHFSFLPPEFPWNQSSWWTWACKACFRVCF